jgi:hypothetical protein
MNARRVLLVCGIVSVIAGAMLAVALYAPSSLPTGSDFSALYNTALALVRGVPIYDLEAVEAVAVSASDVPPEKFFLARFPYPPWYSLSVFYLGYLPARHAATLWFELNLAMLFASLWLLTDGWDGRLRLVAFPLGLMFLPVVGALSVGQYDFPALFGASLLLVSLRGRNIAMTILGAVLLTFKPHIGAFILFATLLWLFYQRDDFSRRALRGILAACGALIPLGFIADPQWIVRYPAMLLNYQGEGNVASCSECASLPVYLSRWFFDGSLGTAAMLALGILLVVVGIFVMNREMLIRSHESFLTFSLLATLLVSPYLYNYDFILLLVPFAVLAAGGTLIQPVVVFVSYIVPTVALLTLSREGNVSLLAAAMVLMWGLARKTN